MLTDYSHLHYLKTNCTREKPLCREDGYIRLCRTISGVSSSELQSLSERSLQWILCDVIECCGEEKCVELHCWMEVLRISVIISPPHFSLLYPSIFVVTTLIYHYVSFHCGVEFPPNSVIWFTVFFFILVIWKLQSSSFHLAHLFSYKICIEDLGLYFNHAQRRPQAEQLLFHYGNSGMITRLELQ